MSGIRNLKKCLRHAPTANANPHTGISLAQYTYRRNMIKRNVLSLFDHSLNWSKPYREAGYTVYCIDKKDGNDILTWDYKFLPRGGVKIILIAMPCTDYALSGAKHFSRKDADGTTEKSQEILRKVKEILGYFQPDIWCLENPMTRIHKLNPWLGKVKFKFNPYDFEDGCQKQTWLFGKFNNPVKTPGKNQGNWMFTNLGGKSERTKELRSITPLGFAYAFYEANHF
jgi:hypothetical protein